MHLYLFYKKKKYLCSVNNRALGNITYSPMSIIVFRLTKMEQARQLVEAITKGIQEKKGSNIVIADLSAIEGSICKFFVICQGNSPAQVEAVTESVGEFASKELGEKPSAVAGLENAQWVAMDYGDVLVHVFLPDVREFYDLEHLWADAPLTRIPELD